MSKLQNSCWALPQSKKELIWAAKAKITEKLVQKVRIEGKIKVVKIYE